MNEAELLNEIGLTKNIHPVCLLCNRQCKQPYSFWSFQMPPNIFCDEFIEKTERKEQRT